MTTDMLGCVNKCPRVLRNITECEALNPGPFVPRHFFISAATTTEHTTQSFTTLTFLDLRADEIATVLPASDVCAYNCCYLKRGGAGARGGGKFLKALQITKIETTKRFFLSTATTTAASGS